MIAALGVWGTATAWPDLVVAGIMAGLFLSSSAQILAQAFRESQERATGLASGGLGSRQKGEVHCLP
jgi:Co/Zn/Cd efflux system component